MRHTALTTHDQARALELFTDLRLPVQMECTSATTARRPRRPRSTGLTLAAAEFLVALAAMTVFAVLHSPITVVAAVVIAVSAPVSGALRGAYRRSVLRLCRAGSEDVAGLVQLGLTTALLLALTTPSHAVTPLELALCALLVVAATAVVRSRLLRVGGAVSSERCVVLTRPERFPVLGRRLTAAGAAVDLVAMVDVDRVEPARTADRTVEQVIETHRADRVVLVADGAADQAAELARRARRAGATVTVFPPAVDALGPGLLPEVIGGTVALSAGPSALTRSDKAAKRALDIGGAGLLLMVFAPVMAVVALAIKATSGGRVLFRQERVGFDGRRFSITKFRTMVEDAESRKAALRFRSEADGLFKIADDPRITRVGRLLRRTSMDELPQLVNVLRGEMSLVGPRPLVREEDARIAGWHRERLLLAPGMTGPWQITGRMRPGLCDMVLLDHQYVANWSVWSDLHLLLRTVGFVVTRRGV